MNPPYPANLVPSASGSAPASASATASVPGQVTRNKSVLVVDDEAGMRVMAKAILATVGYEAELAESGEEAVEMYRARMQGEHGEGHKVVIMDLALPGGISGLEALFALKQIDANCRVIAASGYLEANAREAALRAGFSGVLPKPYTADRLVATIKHLMHV